MSTLSKRATPLQQRILRIVEGAVKNALDAHPGVRVPSTFASSVAKRAAGTLSAELAGMLAVRSMPSDQAQPVKQERAGPAVIELRRTGAQLGKHPQQREAARSCRLPPRYSFADMPKHLGDEA